MKLVFTVLMFSLLSIGCSSSSDNDPPPEDDGLVSPAPGKINADNYAELVGIAEDIGFHTFTREYNLGALTRPFTVYANELLESTDTSSVEDISNCDIAGSTKTTGEIFLGSMDYLLRYEFDGCETSAGTVNGTANHEETLVNIASIKHAFDLEFTNVDVQGERGDRVLQGEFESEDNQQLSLRATFDVASYVVAVPDSMFLEVSGSGTYVADTSFDTQDPSGATADATLTAQFSLTTSSGDGSDQLSVNVSSDLGLASTSDFEVGPPVSGALTISADDNSQVIISPADVAGMVNIDLTAADGAVSRDVRSWSELIAGN